MRTLFSCSFIGVCVYLVRFVCVCSSKVPAFPWVFVVNRDGSLGFSLLRPHILVRIRTLSEILLKGERCTAPEPTRRQPSHLVPALSMDIQFNADTLQLPLLLVCLYLVCFILFVYAPPGCPPFLGFLL